MEFGDETVVRASGSPVWNVILLYLKVVVITNKEYFNKQTFITGDGCRATRRRAGVQRLLLWFALPARC